MTQPATKHPKNAEKSPLMGGEPDAHPRAHPAVEIESSLCILWPKIVSRDVLETSG
jgi:hypothetical protein